MIINEQWGHDFFTMVDRKNADEYSTHFAQDGQVIFGNQPPITGKENIRQGMTQFYAGLNSMHHEIANLWVPAPNVIVNEAVAHYEQKSGKKVGFPVVTVIHVVPGTEKVQKVQFYMDMTPLESTVDKLKSLIS